MSGLTPQRIQSFLCAGFLLALVIALAPFNGKAQDMEEFREFEDSLVVLSNLIYNSHSDSDKYAANAKFLMLLQDALSLNNSFNYPFDSLKLVKILVAPDKKFRIITWMVAQGEGTYEYFGYIQSYSRKKHDYEVYQLTDMSEDMDSPETRVLDHKSWYGVIYYDVILTRYNQNSYYTLLGWDGNNSLIRRRVIEVLTLRSNGMPRFGHSLFRYNRPGLKRVFFEYSSLASMNLRYEKQHYYVTKKKLFSSSSSNRFRRKAIRGRGVPTPNKETGYRKLRQGDHMIVFDHLIPREPSLANHNQYYVPEGNIVNAFVFSGGRWKYIEDIDARNPGHRYDKPGKRPKPELQPLNRN